MSATRKSSFTSQVLIYGLGLALNYGISFLLLPVYTRMMPRELFGVLEIINRNVEFVSMLVMTQYSIAYLRFYREREDEEHRRRVTATCMIVAALVSGVVGLFLTAGSGALSRAFWNSGEYATHISLSGLRYFVSMSFTVPFIYFQATEQPHKYILISSIRIAAIYGLTIYLLHIMEDKLAAALWAPIIVNVLLLATVGAAVFLASSRRIDFSFARRLLKFIWSFSFLGLYGFLMSNGDRYVLNQYCGSAQVGIYAAGYKIGLVIQTFVISPILRAWNARMVEVLRSPTGAQTLARLTTLAFLAYCTAGLALSLYSRELVIVMLDRTYLESYKIVPLVILAYSFSALAVFMDSGIYYSGKTHLKLWHAATTAVCLGLYFLLIPNFCLLGAAWATVATYLFFIVLTWKLATRAYPMNFELRKLLTILLTAIAVYLCNYLFEQYEYNHLAQLRLIALALCPTGYAIGLVLIKSVFLMTFVALILLSGVLGRDDRERIKEIIRVFRRRVAGTPVAPETNAIPPTIDGST